METVEVGALAFERAKPPRKEGSLSFVSQHTDNDLLI